MPLSPGDKLGPYEILGAIGAGGMGEVYKASDTRLGRDVAIKVSAERYNERFEREAKAIASLNHTHICQVYDVGPNYLVMELIDGAPILTKDKPGPLVLDAALRCALQICDALEAAHKKNITHRDLKPGNILMTASGVKLLDFGLAKVGSAGAAEAESDATQTMPLTEAGTVLGTAAYMSPEQAKGEEADARSDIFSFGVVLYELLAGRRAFSRKSSIETMAAVVRDEPAALDVPVSVAAVVTRCLRKLPADRFQTIVEVRAALQQASEQAASKPEKPIPSIAVLPFANMSGDKENEYFSDGLAEEILNLLAKIPNLKVIARTSSFAFRGKEQDITQIAETLRVQNILEGSVRKADNRIRVTAQLINATDGSHLWSERYDRELTDIFAIQDEISQAISRELQVRLAPRAQPVNLEAYQLYLKGQYHRVRFTPESMAKAKEFFEQASAIDPNYAPAYSGLATYYGSLAALGMKSGGVMMPLAKAIAEKALALDPANSEAHSVLGVAAGVFDYDWGLAETHHRKAMAAEPVPAMVRYRYAGYYLIPLGRVQEAIAECRLALETDPLSMPVHNFMVISLIQARHYREAIEHARRALEIDSTFYLLWSNLGWNQLHAGFPQEAMASCKRTVALAPWFSYGEWHLAAAYHLAGNHERSQELVRKLAALHGRTAGAAMCYVVTGEVDAMFEALDGAYQQRDPVLCFIQGDEIFDPYRADPRFQALLRKMNLA